MVAERATPPFCVFIADNNKTNRLLLKSLLESYCKKIILAADAKSVLGYLKNNKYDLIFLDLEMPCFDGFELIKLIRQSDSINFHSPIIAITAHAQSHQRSLLIDAGFDECLIKPVVIGQLLELLDLWLPAPSAPLINSSTASGYVEIMLNKTSGNKKLALTLFNKLFSELLEQPKTIESAIKCNDLLRAKDIIHKLHGSVGFCGLGDMQETANALESSLSSKNPLLIDSNFLALTEKTANFLRFKDEILNQLKPA